MKTETALLDAHIRNDHKDEQSHFNEHDVLHRLKHYLPAQAPLKDFVHHNTLHAFQHEHFLHAMDQASQIFGYHVLLSMDEYRKLYHNQRIRKDILEDVLKKRDSEDENADWIHRLLHKEYGERRRPRIGRLRSLWKNLYHIDIDALVHPLLFRVLGAFLDQGIAMWNFPVWKQGLLASIKEMERNSFHSFFRTPRARNLLLHEKPTVESLLRILVGDPLLYERYLFDQQFSHAGWSGMVSAIEDRPDTLLDHRKISLKEVAIFELLLEIDTLDYMKPSIWKPIGQSTGLKFNDLFAPVISTEEFTALKIWQEAFEWSYYDEVLAGITLVKNTHTEKTAKTFQGLFCIDDRECSIRRHLETRDPDCETFGTPGFFNVEFYYKPEHGRFFTKLCPAPMNPNYLIKEMGSRNRHKRDAHFSKHSHSLFRGWLISSTLGFWSALKLFANIFRPSFGPATAASFKHMDEFSSLSIVNKGRKHEHGLQIGFTIIEMADRVEGLLKSIGLADGFAPLVYAVGHGSSSVNNPHYAAYDCGACSGRPGSVNARVISAMANNPEVRDILMQRGMIIPSTTQFVGALHDTTRDEIIFYDEDSIALENRELHRQNKKVFAAALQENAKERSRRFETINSKHNAARIHEKVRKRSVSLFEPRPELNHATNALCIVGRREITKGLFLDRRSFLNSYDYLLDPDGTHLFGILKAVAPVCGGINLEYFFSRMDNLRLGAGTKLPHNVVGLFGVSNGTDGDLRPGLPSQMIEVHDPIRLLVIVEHFPDIVLSTIKRESATYQWFANHWVHLVVVDPVTRELSHFRNDGFEPYTPLTKSIETVGDLNTLIESDKENFPVYLID